MERSTRRDERDQRRARRDARRDRIRKRAEGRERQGGGGTKYALSSDISFFTMKKKMSLDIIPYVVSIENHPEGLSKGDLWYQRTVWVHYAVGAEEKSYLCPLKTVKKRCPICEHRAEAMKQDKPDEELLKALKPRERELFNVFDQDEPDKGVQLWDVSYHLFGKHLEEEIREGKPEYAGFSEPEDGFTLKIRATEEVMGGNKFMEATRIDFEERASIEPELLAKALDLDAILKILPYEELERIFLELESSESAQDKGTEDREADLADRPREQRSSSRKEEPAKSSLPSESMKTEPSKRTPTKAPTNGLECPAGGTFGKDCDELDACRTCEIWEPCADAQEKQNAK